MDAPISNSITSRKVWAYIAKSVKPFPVSVFVLFYVACISAIDFSLRPYLLKVIVDLLTLSPQAEVLTHLAMPVLLYIGVYLFTTTTQCMFDYFVSLKMIAKLRQNITKDALDMLLEKSHSYYQDNFAGSLSNKINDLITGVSYIVQFSAYRFTLRGLALIVAMFTLWQANVIFACAMLAWASLLMTLAF